MKALVILYEWNNAKDSNLDFEEVVINRNKDLVVLQDLVTLRTTFFLSAEILPVLGERLEYDKQCYKVKAVTHLLKPVFSLEDYFLESSQHSVVKTKMVLIHAVLV